AAIGDLQWRLHGTDAILAKAGQAIDHALAEPSEASVAQA
ncbi:acyl-CoA dehydrogenase family protein, partial [Pseudomonas syringae pv. pisi str. 1704B]